MDEVFVTINSDRHYLWRAVDQDGDVLNILVQKHLDKRAAKRFFRKLLKGMRYSPRLIVTDKLRSYGAAKREIMPGVVHRQGKWENNRAEVSHQPTRQREWQMLSPFLNSMGTKFDHGNEQVDPLIAAAHKLLCEPIEFQPLLIYPPSGTGCYR